MKLYHKRPLKGEVGVRWDGWLGRSEIEQEETTKL